MRETNGVPIETMGERHLERLILLSDGIFAIAATLSALEIRPEVSAGETLWQAWSIPLAVYFISFLLIGQIWFYHRRVMAHLSDIDGPGTVLNLVLLSLVALVPVVMRFALNHGERRDATEVYCTEIAITYACMGAMWGYVAFVGKLAPTVNVHLSRVWFLRPLFVTFAFSCAALYAASHFILSVACLLVTIFLRLGSMREQKRAQRELIAGPALPE